MEVKKDIVLDAAFAEPVSQTFIDIILDGIANAPKPPVDPNKESGWALDDTVFKARLSEIIAEHKITTVVETGVNEGKSTLDLSYMVDRVIGIDLAPECIVQARNRLIAAKRKNFMLHEGNSPEVLVQIREDLDTEHTLYFLDAHWNAYWPILDEIAAITPGQGILVMHDFVVPEHPELGFDSHGTCCFCYKYVQEALTKWSATHRVEYNSKGDHSSRGIGYIYPR